MAINSRNAMPQGNKYRVFLEKGERKDFMMVYAPSKEDAIASVRDSWRGTGWKVTGAEDVRREPKDFTEEEYINLDGVLDDIC